MMKEILSSMTIGGFVGIGTSKQKKKLSVNRNILAREIKIETANWPDYVLSRQLC